MATASSAVVSDDIADVLGEVGILTTSGEPVKFRDLWDQHELGNLPHHSESKELFDSAGVKLIAVGVGTPDKARLLAESCPSPWISRKAYDVLGLYYGLVRTFFNPASTKVFSRIGELKKAMKNYTMKATPNDRSSVLQHRLVYARKDEGTGDHASLDHVFDICCKATAG